MIAYGLGMQGLYDRILLVYFVACGVSRLARYNVTAEELSGGSGKVTIVSQDGPDAYKVLGAADTAPGARTSFFVSDTGRLYVAVPHRGAQQAEIQVFQVVGAK